jgi:hypothetical protein
MRARGGTCARTELDALADRLAQGPNLSRRLWVQQQGSAARGRTRLLKMFAFCVYLAVRAHT